MKIKDITPSNIRNFVEGNINFYTKNYPTYQLEQFLYRAYLCSPCLENGKCTHCGCKTPQMFFAPRKQDAQDNWPPFFFAEPDWEQYKKDHLRAMQFSNYLVEKVLGNTNGNIDLDIVSIVNDAKALIDAHREQDTENPDIPVEQTERYKEEVHKEAQIRDQYVEASSNNTLAGTILV